MSNWGQTLDFEIAENVKKKRRHSKPVYKTKLGQVHCAPSEKFLKSSAVDAYRGKVDLVFSSPPFPLLTSKEYGNHRDKEYIRWLASFAPLLTCPPSALVRQVGAFHERRISGSS